MRVDKFLKISRILKRRTVANDAAKGGRVTVRRFKMRLIFKNLSTLIKNLTIFKMSR